MSKKVAFGVLITGFVFGVMVGRGGI